MQNASLLSPFCSFLITLLFCQSILISHSVSVFSSMASSQTRTLTALVIFQNFLYPVMYRSVHVYRTEAGKEEMEEREYLLHETSNFEETRFAPVITLHKFDVSAQFVGILNGVWKCMFVYDSDRHQSTSVDASPEWLSIAENPKMEFIPTLANDLHAISELALNVEFGESSGRSTTEESGENKKRRAATEDVARLALEDLSKYFDLSIVEASNILKVGLTVLTKKCREFGNP